MQLSRAASRSGLSEAAAPSESVFRHRAFALYWFSRIASILSFHMLVVAVGWQLYELTGSAFDLGLLGLAQFGPMLVLTLFVGHVADRYDHRLILMLCQITEGVRRRDPGLCDRDRHARHARHLRRRRGGRLGPRLRDSDHGGDHPSLVPRAWCQRAMAWFASANQTGQIVGPALGGVLYLLGPTTVYGVTIVLWGLGGFMLALMRVEPAPRSTEPFSLSSLLGGFRFVRARPHHPRHLVARHVRGVSRRRDRAAADLRPRHPADRAVGAWPAALGARRSAR